MEPEEGGREAPLPSDSPWLIDPLYYADDLYRSFADDQIVDPFKTKDEPRPSR